jgi:hypothetical protein
MVVVVVVVVAAAVAAAVRGCGEPSLLFPLPLHCSCCCCYNKCTVTLPGCLLSSRYHLKCHDTTSATVTTTTTTTTAATTKFCVMCLKVTEFAMNVVGCVNIYKKQYQ